MSNESPSDSSSVPVPGTPADPSVLLPAFQRFSEVVAKLRSRQGCPWDRKQTLETLKSYTLEETYELLEAIDSGDDEAIVEELGDVLLQVVLDAQIGADEGRFDLTEVIQGITEKMIHRHPHVFGNLKAETVDDVRQHWDRAKKEEKNRDSELDGIPADLPQLARASRISSKAARVGYDFPVREMLFDKLREEINELAAELFEDGELPIVPTEVETVPVPDEPIEDQGRKQRVEKELGDILFVVANIARRWGINPEEALRSSNRKFSERFQYIERELAKAGSDIQTATLQEMEDLYQQGKRKESAGTDQ